MLNKKLKEALIIFITIIMISSVWCQPTVFAASNSYYVSPDAEPYGDGSINSPFNSLTEAVKNLQAGDTLYLMGGIYREKLDLSNLSGSVGNEIRIMEYPGQNAEITGTSLVTNWTKDGENIWAGDYDSTIQNPVVFNDGQQIYEARWPNLDNLVSGESPLLNRSNYARVESAVQADGKSTYGQLTDSDLSAFSDSDLTGTKIWSAADWGYVSYFLDVKEHDRETNTISVAHTGPAGYLTPKSRNIYYLFGSKMFLDYEGEYFAENGKIFYYTSSSTPPENMEVQTREDAVIYGNAKYVSVSGIDVYGGCIDFGASDNCTFSNAAVEAGRNGTPLLTSDHRLSAKGITLSGTNNMLYGCEVKNMPGGGVVVSGSDNRVINNYMHDLNTFHTGDAGIMISGARHLISHNKVTRTGRHTVGGRFDACVISYNDLSDSSRLSWDSGVLYFNAYNYKNSEIHHNIIHDDMNNDGEYQYGLYFDSFTTSMHAYNNVIYNIDNPGYGGNGRASININPNSLYVTLYNTVINHMPVAGASMYNQKIGDRSGLVMINNIFSTVGLAKEPPEGITYKKNLHNFSNWNNAAANDYSVSAGTSADNGYFVSGIHTAGEKKAYCGAYPIGETPWRAGHDFSVDYSGEKYAVNDKLPGKNLISNMGFEGTDSWNYTGETERFEHSSWSYSGMFSKDGEYSLKLWERGSATQVIENLKPNTIYEFGGYGMLRSQFVFFSEWAAHSAIPGMNRSPRFTSIRDGDWLEYKPDIADRQYDTIVICFRRPNTNNVVTVRRNDVNGEVLATVPMNGESDVNGWMMAKAPINIPSDFTKEDKLCLCFDGSFVGSEFAGFYFDRKNSGDSLTFTAVSDSGETETVVLTDKSYNIAAAKKQIKTGNSGKITVSIEKNGADMYGYADCMYVRESVSSIELLECNIANENGEIVYSFERGNKHTVSGVVKNNTSLLMPIQILLESYDSSNILLDSVYEILPVNSGNQGEFSLSVIASNDFDGYLKLTVTSDDDIIVNRITDSTLKQQYHGEKKVMLKNFLLRDKDGNVVSELIPGQFQIIEVNTVNFSSNKETMVGCVAIYNENDTIVDILSINRNINAMSEDCYGIGFSAPKETGCYVKIFTFSSVKTLRPLVENKKFDIVNQ